jgi:hypothetical protein
MADGLAQLASISAVLGGFAVTFLSVVLTIADARRRVGVVLGIATGASACFFVSALGWSLLAARGHEAAFVARYEALQQPLSLLFLLGIWLLLALLGISGWLRSRPLGLVTAGIASVAALGTGAVLLHLIR